VNGETRAANGDATIVVEGLRHVYRGGTVALDGVDLRIGTGLFGLLGPNGAGKSTLMRIVCTLLVPTAGRVEVAGRDVTRERRAVRQRLGYLPQELGVWRLQRVDEALDTLALLSGLDDRAHREERVKAVLRDVGLEEVAHRKVKKLSGGMLRRLGVAQALVHEPAILIVDEPTVGLDPEERIRFRKLMASLGTERTIVLSTHIVADLGGGCEHIALIDAGELAFDGAPRELLAAADRVFEVTLPAGREEALGDGFEVVSRAAAGSEIRARGVVTGEKPPPGATPVSAPTLEEAYLSFMAARGRAAEVGQNEAAIATGAES
jgi:ABC-type multidrug transport system ATPase subunit